MENKEELKNDIMEVNMGKPQVTLNNEFQEVLAQIPDIVKRSEDILGIDIDQLEDKDINEVDKELRNITSFTRKIEKGRKDLRSYLNDRRDEITNIFDQRLNESGYDKVPDLSAKIRQRKNDIKTHRINQRWEELRSTFEQNIAIYPDMFNQYPDLQDFSSFKLHHDKLVSGAKTKKITDKTRGEINTEIGQWSNLLNTIQNNQWNLNPTNLNSLVQMFVQNPTKYATDSMLLINNANMLQDEQEKEEALAEQIKQQQLAKEAETKKQAELKAQQVQSQPQSAPVEPQPAQPKAFQPQAPNPTKPVVKHHSEFEALNDFIASSPNFKNISQNNKVKCSLLFEYFVSLAKQNNTPLTKLIGTNPDDVVKAIKHILDM